MFSTRSLYFACPNEFDDPYEGYLPRSHVQAHVELVQKYVQQIRETAGELAARFPDRDHTVLDDVIKKAQSELHAPTLLKSVTRRFGVNCWHRSDIESAAMWGLYGRCVAIESSLSQLQSSFRRADIIFSMKFDTWILM